ncbi:MAG: VWA domain-containing protein [Hyphomicrobium sp.]
MDAMPQKAIPNAQSLIFNPDRRLPLVLVCDTSGSMIGAPIDQLNLGLQTFNREVSSDAIALRRIEAAVVEFNSTVTVRQDFATVDQFQMPVLAAGGMTSMATAVTRALAMAEARKRDYSAHSVDYYRPIILLNSDGASSEPLDAAIKAVAAAERDKKAAFFAVGVDGADFSELQRLSVRPVLHLLNLDFPSLFQWLSRSAVQGSKSPLNQGMQFQPTPANVIQVSQGSARP